MTGWLAHYSGVAQGITLSLCALLHLLQCTTGKSGAAARGAFAIRSDARCASTVPSQYHCDELIRSFKKSYQSVFRSTRGDFPLHLHWHWPLISYSFYTYKVSDSGLIAGIGFSKSIVIPSSDRASFSPNRLKIPKLTEAEARRHRISTTHLTLLIF